MFSKKALTSLTLAATLMVSSPVYAASIAPEKLNRPSKTSEEIEAAALDDLDMSQEEWEVLYLTNYIRSQNGLEALSTYPALQSAAKIRTNELPTLFSHTRPDGTDCFTALTQQNVSYRTAGENIAGGQWDSAMALNSWMNSDGHRANILGSQYSHIGTGYCNDGPYWLQLFTGSCQATSINIAYDEGYTYWVHNDEIIDDWGFILEVTCPHGTSYLPLMESMCTGYDASLSHEFQTIDITYRGASTSLNVLSYPTMNFSDVPDGAWYYDSVNTVYSLGIMTGLDNTNFGATQNLARAQFAVILQRMCEKFFEEDTSVTGAAAFPDVPDGIWYSDAIRWASTAGIVTGYTDTGLFGPNDPINREQIAVMMYRFANYLGYDTSGRASLSSFNDASQVNSFAKDALEWAVYEGIITGKDNKTRIAPQEYAIRAECAAIIERFLFTYL